MSLRTLDLFAGCGGLSLGLREAGHTIIAACEIDRWAAETYRANHHGVTMFESDITTLSDVFLARQFRGEVDLVAGGPPCQGFSVSGKRQYGELSDKNRLIKQFIRVIEVVKPRYVLFENVAGFATGRMSAKVSALTYVQTELSRLAYNVRVLRLQAADYGVPSLRSRLFIIAAQSPFPSSVELQQTHSADGGLLFDRHISIMDAIDDLPVLRAGEGHEGTMPYATAPRNAFQTRARAGSRGVFNHVAMRHTRRLVERFASMRPGESGFTIGADSGTRVTVYKSNNQRLLPSAPSLCITANFQSNYVHPTQHRNLTAREAARLMTFPDGFIFKGKRTLMSTTLLRAEGRHGENFLSQYNQIGNAVPPLLATKLGELLGALSEKRYPRHHSEVELAG